MFQNISSQYLAWKDLNAMHVIKNINGRHHWQDISERNVEESLSSSVRFVPVEPS
jgi:hypothetical protein